MLCPGVLLHLNLIPGNLVAHEKIMVACIAFQF